jgi:hypothetical protein
MQDGPTILVGHTYGGAIITAAGNDSHIVAFACVAANALDGRETEPANGQRFPNATTAIKKTDDRYVYHYPSLDHTDFAADPVVEAIGTEDSIKDLKG